MFAISDDCTLAIILFQIQPFSLGSFAHCNAFCCFYTSLISICVSDKVHWFNDFSEETIEPRTLNEVKKVLDSTLIAMGPNGNKFSCSQLVVNDGGENKV
ncbi:trihelix transcription factor gt-3a-like: PROVISIONAL [Gigaspora margarita]|uniref:Trihelix transcription factor gt-3a-like: PROVISIONAL n=1 Tax=Gigaspora margarita TaxID=4874 RepID=A0A8H4ES30_GIGMA|nr:trihelix transcription factor gt-3a-like: PROVISIONAL [Gigaspora margarita]